MHMDTTAPGAGGERGVRANAASTSLIEVNSIPVPEAGCWLWTGTRGRGGYGVIRVMGKLLRAHRLSWKINHGHIPHGMMVCHRCDTPACVNPEHLFIGTARDNTHDAIRKGRIADGPRAPSARLTLAEALEVYRSSERQDDLARRFGVTLQVIERIKRGLTWARHTNGLRRGGIGDRRLTRSQVADVAASNGSQREIARRFGVSQSHVSRIKKRPAP